MKGLTLKIFSHNQESQQLKDIGVDFKYSDCDVDDVTFYRINGISSEPEDNKTYTCIYANGGRFVCVLSPDEVRDMIRQAYKNGDLR